MYSFLRKIKNIKKEYKYIIIFIILLIVLDTITFITVFNIRIKEIGKREEIIAQENEKWDKTEKLMNKEKEFYNKLLSTASNNFNYKNPFLPENFVHIEGEWNTGFVIQDDNGNQYVWVPCIISNANEENNITVLKKNNFMPEPLITYIECYDESYEQYLKSVADNGGFYISRFEIGNENGKAVSKIGAQLWSEVSREEVFEIVDNMYDEKINCELINGFAYDTVLTWILKNSSNNISSNEFDVNILQQTNQNINLTGRKKYNNIYDLFDNVMEYTGETYYETVVVRGVLNGETLNEFTSRYCVLKEDISLSKNAPIGFRTIIYK